MTEEINVALHRAVILSKIEQAESAVMASLTPLRPEHFAEQKRVDSEREAMVAQRRPWWRFWGAA